MNGYIALVYEPDESGEYAVTFPDLPGCTTCGSTFGAAVEAAREALSGHLAALRDDGDPIPAPRAYEAIRADASLAEDREGATLHLVYPRPVRGQHHDR